MTIRIRIEHGQDAGRTWRLAQPGVYLMGRGKGVSMHVLDMKVSKAHAEVHVVEENGSIQHVIKELGSTHGSQVNGQPLSGVRPLRPGDEVRVGLTILRVLSDGQADLEPAPMSDRQSDDSVTGQASSHGSIDTSSVKALPPDALVGKVLGGYRIEKKIGQGGMGAVYIAEQVSLHRKVALKVLSEKFVKDSAFVDQFLNEARAAGALNHPNVVQVYDVGEAEGHYYFSMEFVSGGSIEDVIRGGQAASWQDALNWFLDATNALVFAGKRNTLHRDVKPDNLMLSEDGSAKLCDLGLAKRSENEDLMDQGIIGTPHFISPEAIRRKTNIDHRTDLYSLGCTFFRIFTGRNPYPAGTVKEILLGHLRKPVPTIQDVNKEVPRELSEIVEKLMQKEPENRFQSADELLVSLDKVRVRHGLEAHGIAPKSRKPVIIGAVVALLIAIGAVVFALNQEPDVIKADTTEADRREMEARIVSRVAEIGSDAADIRSSVSDIDRKRNDARLMVDPEEWRTKKSSGLGVAKEYETWAATQKGVLDGWREEQGGAETADRVKTALGEAIASVTGEIARAEKSAKEIRDYFQKREANAAEEERLRGEGKAMAEKAIQDHLEKVRGLLQEVRDRPQAAAEVLPELAEAKIQGLVQPALDHAVLAGESLLDFDRHFKEALEKAFQTETWLSQVDGWIKNSHTTALATAKKDVGDPPAIEGYEKAMATLTTWIDKLPEAGAEDNRYATQLNDYRQVAVKKRTEYETARDDLRYGNLLHDRDIYFALVRRLRAPLGFGDGLMSSFHHDPAAAAVDKARETMRTELYDARLDMWARDIAAFKDLMTQLTSTCPWSGGERTIEWVDADGKKVRFRAQGAGPDYILGRGDERLEFRKITKAFLLNTVILPEGQPRCPLAGAQHRGLGVLAEMAGDMDAAATHYDAYLATNPGEVETAEIRARKEALRYEALAAERWTSALTLLREVADYLDARDDPTDWPKHPDQAEDLADPTTKPMLLDKIGRAQQARDDLTSKPELMSTVWGTSVAAKPGRALHYLGERIPEAFIARMEAERRKPGPGDGDSEEPPKDNGAGNGG